MPSAPAPPSLSVKSVKGTHLASTGVLARDTAGVGAERSCPGHGQRWRVEVSWREEMLDSQTAGFGDSVQPRSPKADVTDRPRGPGEMLADCIKIIILIKPVFQKSSKFT